MSDSAAENLEPQDSELEELSETLVLPARPDVMSPSTLLPNPPDIGENSIRLSTFLKSKGAINFYDAVIEGEQRSLLVRETNDDVTAQRLRREADMLRPIVCPMLPKIYGCFDADGHTYLLTEHLEGTTFADIVAGGVPNFQQALSILSQAAFALSRLHEAGWVHLGLRPSAIIASKPIKVTDFSYATKIGTIPEQRFYHAGFSAPELLSGEPVDARADIYAIGGLLFRALSPGPLSETGPLLTGSTLAASIAGVPQILHRCLGPRADRYSSMAELHHDLVKLSKRSAAVVQYDFASATSIGLEPSRTTNQDACCYCSGRLDTEEGGAAWGMAVVADGMGGMEAGELASSVAVKAVLLEANTAFAQTSEPNGEEQARLVTSWLQTATSKVFRAMERAGARGGCTLACIALCNRRLAIAHAGDCRIYLIRDGSIQLLTRDHSVAMRLVTQGVIQPSELRTHPDRSCVTRSIGGRATEPEGFFDTLRKICQSSTLSLSNGDLLLVCSDGLWEPVLEEDMLAMAAREPRDLGKMADSLVRLALERGAPDNCTALLVRVRESHTHIIAPSEG